MTRSERRLFAILHADVAGFVRLVEREEELTFESLREVRSRVWQPAIESVGGVLVNSTGDAILAQFESAVTAVQTAIAIQERMARFNESLAEEQRLLFRIGVHVGEIIVDEAGHDIFGDGVNLAERIQVLAEPGGIAVSRAVRDVTELQLQADYAYVDGGVHHAKHVSRPLHIYRVRAHEIANTLPRASMPARGTFRFRGADPRGHKFDFDVDFDALVKGDRLVTIGRDSAQCDIVLLHASVSRRHARLSVGTDNNLQIEDIGSTNGTAIDGRPIPAGAAPEPLAPGSTLRLGDIELVVRYD
jgi:class 3 adenylate cyclase